MNGVLKEVADHDRASGSLLSIERLRTHLFTSKGVVKAVDGVSFDIKPHEIMGLVRESGSGKTMTGLSIMQLLPSPPAKIVDGRIMFNGEDLTKIPDDEIRKIRGSKISMVFQDPLTSLNPLIRVGKQVSEVIQIHSSLPKEPALSKAIEILEQVGIPEARTVASQYPFELSGGMRQRVMIAAAVASRPELLIADEPTTNLDTTIQAQVLSLLRQIRDTQGTSILLITHNLGIVAWICDRVAVLYAGRLVEIGPTNAVLRNPSHPYTQALLRSVPRIDSERGKLETIAGEVPRLTRLPINECHFHPRCPYAKSVCKSEEPDLIQIGKDHFASCFIYSKDWEQIK